MKQYSPNDIRSFILAGHSGGGKTSVGDAIARITGLNNRLGSVSDLSSLLDFEPEEKERGGSLSSAMLTCEYEGLKLHILDTPGDGDFIHTALPCLQAVDSAVLVISAIDGVEIGTEKLNTAAVAQGKPRTIFINKLDREHANHAATLKEIKDVLGVEPVLLQLPIGTSESFSGIVDLVEGKAYTYTGDAGTGTAGEIPEELAGEVELAVEALTEAVAMTDDDLVEKYLEEGELTSEEIRSGLRKGFTSGTIVPVLLGSASKNIGVDRLLNLSRAFPGPQEGKPTLAHREDKPEETTEILGDADGPFVALCFKTMIDPFFGHLSLFRVVSGTATTDTHPVNARTGNGERIGGLLHLVGKETVPVDKVVPGDLFAVAKLKETQTGDTLGDGKERLVVQWNPGPKPMISFVVKPLSRADEDKMRGAIEKTLAEDQGIQQSFDETTHEFVLSGMGANHITVAVAKIKRKYKVNLELDTPTIPYRETISKTADVRYRHKKQTGGAGQFGEVYIKYEPNDRGAGFEFTDSTVGGVIPNSLIPSVEKGVRFMLDRGVLAGFPIVDIRANLYDGKSHPVDSKDIAFQMAGRMATKKAVADAKPILLEPIYDVEVVGPEENVGDLMGDMNQRRARIQSMEGRGRNSVVKAYVPLAEMLSYAPALKSMTGGKGSYSMEFHTYDPVPPADQAIIVGKVNRLQAEEDE